MVSHNVHSHFMALSSTRSFFYFSFHSVCVCVCVCVCVGACVCVVITQGIWYTSLRNLLDVMIICSLYFRASPLSGRSLHCYNLTSFLSTWFIDISRWKEKQEEKKRKKKQERVPFKSATSFHSFHRAHGLSVTWARIQSLIAFFFPLARGHIPIGIAFFKYLECARVRGRPVCASGE